MTPAPVHQPAGPNTLLRQELNVVKISMCPPGLSEAGQLGATSPGDQARVLFDITIRGEAVARLEATAEETGLPLTLAAARASQRNEGRFRLPSHILAALETVAPDDGWPLWLSFPRSCGYLPVLPWEPLLKSRLSIPVLRLSYTDVQPIRSREALDVVACFSFPRAKELLASGGPQYQPPDQTVRYFFDRIPANLEPYTTFHVFGDEALYPLLQSVSAENPGLRIIVYDPRAAAQYSAPEAEPDPSGISIESLESPWLLWIRDSLGQTSIDLAHFICHGYLGKEEGVLALSHSPVRNDDEEWSRFIGARQLCSFLDQIGAWSVAFSSPPGNYSISGLRMLHDQIARMRPGPVLFHDAVRDPERLGWDEAFQYAYALEEAQAPRSDAVSLCCHPDWALPGTEADTQTQQFLKELTVAGQLADLFQGRENTPSWLASGQRALERSVAQLFETSKDPTRALSGGAADALRFASEVLRRHAARLGQDLGKK